MTARATGVSSLELHEPKNKAEVVEHVRTWRDALSSTAKALDAVPEDVAVYGILQKRAKSAATVFWHDEYYRRPGAATHEGRNDLPRPPALHALPLVAIAAESASGDPDRGVMHETFDIAPCFVGGWCRYALEEVIREVEEWLSQHAEAD